MATHDNGGQSRASRSREETDEVVDAAESDVAERHERLGEDVDAILDDIDEVLESNSEEFVRGFVQKGGE
ncbi:MAG: ubiquitin-like protein Pup [bacterium]